MSIPVRLIQAWSAEDILNYRILSALLMLWAFIFLFRRKALKQDVAQFVASSPKERKKVFILTFISAILIFGNWYTYIYAINNISIQSAAFAYMLCPLITTFAAFIILKEELSKQKWFALALAFISVCLLATGSLYQGLMSIAIASLYAFYLICQRVIRGYDKLNLLAIQLLICSVFIIPVLIIQGHALPESTLFWSVTILIAVVFTIIPLFLSMYALIGISSSTAGILLYINPIIAFLIAIFYFQEDIDPRKYLAYGVLIAAILLFNWKTVQKLFSSKKLEPLKS